MAKAEQQIGEVYRMADTSEFLQTILACLEPLHEMDPNDALNALLYAVCIVIETGFDNRRAVLEQIPSSLETIMPHAVALTHSVDDEAKQ